MEMKLAIGWIERGGGKVLMGGPPSALATRTDEVILLQPGDEDPRDLVRKLTKRFGCDTEEALRLLPPGKSKVLSQ
jgi:hypothetical protein